MLTNMKTQTHLKPGQKGTKRLVEKYGDALFCVRYRLDKARGIRLKTVEIIVEQKEAGHLHKDDELVPVAVAYTENGLRERLKAAGGRWSPQEKLWHVRYGTIKGDAELESRILAL